MCAATSGSIGRSPRLNWPARAVKGRATSTFRHMSPSHLQNDLLVGVSFLISRDSQEYGILMEVDDEVQHGDGSLRLYHSSVSYCRADSLEASS